MKNIGILFGGNSTEYNVSLESAYGVITHMDRTKYLPVLIGIRRMPQSKAYGFLKETTSPGLPWTAYFPSFTGKTARMAQSRGFWKWPGSR